MTIGERIKLKRNEKNFTLDYVAKKVKTSRQTIQRYECGIISNIPSDKIEALAIALDVSPAYLMGWEDEESFPSIKKELIRSVESMSDSEIQLMLTIAKGIIEQRNK